MLKFLKFSPKFVGKYGALFVLFSVLGSPVASYNTVHDWYTAPTRLELGDWTKVVSCGSCDHVAAGSFDMCPSCGGEELDARKAQTLGYWERFLGVRVDDEYDIVGYAFPDGTNTSLPPGFVVPERVTSDEERVVATKEL